MNSFENEKKNDEMKNLVESTSLFSSTKSSRKSVTILKQSFAITFKQFVKRRDRALSIFNFVSSFQNVVDFSSSSIVFPLKKKRKVKLKVKNANDSTDSSIENIKKKRSKNKKLAKRILFISAFSRLLFDYEKKLELK